MQNTKVTFQKISLSVYSVLLLFVFLEISARIYLVNFAGEQTFSKYASLQQLEKKSKLRNTTSHHYSPHRYLGYYPTPNYKKLENKHNSLGYRGDEIAQPKPKGEFRIVCIGGSTTYTALWNYQMSYPYLLEKELVNQGYSNINVINAGVDGWSSWESLINFQLRVLDLDPNMIIIYHGINDIHPRIVWPPEAYKGDNSGAKKPYLSISMPSIFEYSTVIRILLIRAGLIKSHAAFTRTVSKRKKTSYSGLFAEQKIKKVYPEGIFKEISASQMLMTNKPVYFKRNIENIVAIAKYRGIKTILATFAYSPLFDDPKVASEEYISAYEETNKTLKGIANETGVNYFDFASLFPTDKQYFTDGRHLTAEGVKLKAKLFAQYIIKENLISDRE